MNKVMVVGAGTTHAEVAAKLKTIVPKSWKYSLSVRHHSTLVFTLASSPLNFLAAFKEYQKNASDPFIRNGYVADHDFTHIDVNPYFVNDRWFALGVDNVATIQAILDAMNDGNHNRSDIMTDYHDVGWYVGFKVGKWDKPYICTAE